MCFPRIQAFDKLRGRSRYSPTAGGGRHVRPDGRASLDRWHAAPDEPLLLRPGARPARSLTEAEGLRLGAQGINPLQCVRPTTPGHSPLKTLARGSAVGPDSVLLMARRRQLLTINSLELGTRWARFEGRDRNSWPKLTRQVRAFLLSLAATGGLGKAAGTEFGEVVCDARLHNETDLLDGTVHVLVSLPTLRAGEFRAFMITHGRDGSQIRWSPRTACRRGRNYRAGAAQRPAARDPSSLDDHGAPAHACARALWFGARSARRHGIVNDCERPRGPKPPPPGVSISTWSPGSTASSTVADSASSRPDARLIELRPVCPARPPPGRTAQRAGDLKGLLPSSLRETRRTAPARRHRDACRRRRTRAQ